MNIIYLCENYYLSNPVFFAIAKEASKQGHINIYFDPKDTGFDNTNKINDMASKVDYCFDYHHVEKNPLVVKSLKDIKNIIGIREYKKKLHKQIEAFKPDIVVAVGDMGGCTNRMINNWCEKNKIPYVIMQPSFLESSIPKVKDVMLNKLGYLLFNKILDIPLFRRQQVFGCEKKSNYLFLWGTDFKKMYKGTCIEQNIRLVGNPVFDNMQENIDRSHFNTPVALLCPSMFNGVISKKNELKVQKMYQDIVKQNPHVEFIVKVHPRETVEQYQELLKDCGSNYFITKTANLYDLFRVVDVQISLMSYTSFESVVAGIPTIILGSQMLLFPFEQFNHEAILKADNIDKFNFMLKLCLSKRYVKKFKKLRIDYLQTKLKYLHSKSSSEHVVQELEKIKNETN